jgi:predicted short-subunit dehydrogenase-like oxidoreductase (DUF2520 family)
MREPVGFIGAGSLASALAPALAAAGYPIAAVASRSRSSAEALATRLPGAAVSDTPREAAALARVVFITTSDSAIEPVAAAVDWRADQIAVHCSGTYGSELLKAAAGAGAATGVFHPLQTFPDRHGSPEKLHGAWTGIQGDAKALVLLEQVGLDLGMPTVHVPDDGKALYHVACVLVSNYLVTLAGEAAALWDEIGLDRGDALRAITPLMHGIVDNIGTMGLPACLTGPIARGDTGTIQRHLAALEQRSPGLLPLYQTLGRYTIPIAESKGGLTPHAAEELNALFGATP